MQTRKNIAIIGGGPAGLIAAEFLAKSADVTIYDRMPSLGRKLLMAGRGGLNLTHSENLEKFISRYGAASNWIAQYIHAFPPDALRAWCEGLGQEVFVGSSGRVFPKVMKAAPLLRAWLRRLDDMGVRYAARHTWQGWEGSSLKFSNADGEAVLVNADATLLALGGASWPRLGSDGGWAEILAQAGVKLTPLRPANCGFMTGWSEYFFQNFAGAPIKAIAVSHNGIAHQGEVMITAQGIEGGAIYAISSALRDAIDTKGFAEVQIDLRPNMTVDALAKKLQERGSQSLSTYLKKAGFSPVAIALLREVTPPEALNNSEAIAARLKSLPVRLIGTAGIARAISTAGGIALSELNSDLMLKAKPGVFAAGEMLDWEAPTGGYLLQACFATGVAAAKGILNSL
jgi:uncharacterized flavoprotein (TIGR03862 family)